jgi:glycosyltransferase involved in cell wall biosynthesis
MAAALPVVVTDTVGNNETVVPGESGLLVPPDDPAALAGALVRLRSDPGLAHRLGIQARRRVEREFTARLMAQRTRAAYQHALAVAGVRRAPVPA